MGVCLLFVSAADRDWAQGLASALVLELAPNQTHNWLFSHKANSQTGRLTITLLILWGQESEGGCFSSTTLVSSRVAFTTSNDVSHYSPGWIICRRAGKGRRSDVWHLFNFIALVMKNSLSQSRSELFYLRWCLLPVPKIQLTALLSNSKSSFYFVPRYFTQQTNSCCGLYGNLNNIQE